MTKDSSMFDSFQIENLTRALHSGAASGSGALASWLSVPAVILIESVDQRPLEEVTETLRETGEAVCVCAMQMNGTLTGQMLLAFDDASGLAMADRVIGRPIGTSADWGEMEISSVLESMNILGSAYLNGIARELSEGHKSPVNLVPSPPTFLRDFAESLLQAAFMEQAAAGNQAIFARARFETAGNPANWTFLLIPDPPSLARLSTLLDDIGGSKAT